MRAYVRDRFIFELHLGQLLFIIAFVVFFFEIVGFSSTECQVTVRSTSPVTIYLLLFVGLVPLMFLEGDFLGSDGGLGSIGLACGDTFATSSFNLFDFKLGLETLGITNLSVALFDVVCSGTLAVLVTLTGMLRSPSLLASGRWSAFFAWSQRLLIFVLPPIYTTAYTQPFLITTPTL